MRHLSTSLLGAALVTLAPLAARADKPHRVEDVPALEVLPGASREISHVTSASRDTALMGWALRSDDRVTVLDRVNVRHLEPAQVAPPPSLVTADLSFISLSLVLPALIRCAAPDADFVLLVKPQFEVGKGHVGAGGVVRDPGLRAAAVSAVATAAADNGLGVAGVTASPLPGPAGNVEYFLWLRSGAPPLEPDRLAQVIAEGPQ